MSDSDNSEKAEELLKQSKSQKRHTTDPSSSDENSAPRLQDAVRDAYARLDEGELHENLTVRDGDLAALVAALEETDQLSTIGDQANEWLGRDGDAESRAAVLKALLRVGLQDVASDEVEAAKEGKREFLASQADEF